MRTSTSRRARRPWTWPGGGWPLRSCSSSPSGWSGSAPAGRWSTCPLAAAWTWSFFYRALPFTLTDAQRRCVEEALADMRSGTPMNRLCQGDVGSGKTMVAAACVYFMVKNGRQAAPDGPYGDPGPAKHYQGLAPLLENLGIRCALLTGSTTAKTKRSITQQLESGEIDFAIGTHALITGGVAYRDLGLVVTDEQSTASVWPSGRNWPPRGTTPHSGHVRYPHPPDPGPDPLRRPGRVHHRPAAPRPPAGADLRRHRGLSPAGVPLHPQAGGRGPPGLHRLSHGRGE